MITQQRRLWFVAAICAFLVGFAAFIFVAQAPKAATPFIDTPLPTPAALATTIAPTTTVVHMPTAKPSATPTIIPSRSLYDPTNVTSMRVVRSIMYAKNGQQPMDGTTRNKDVIIGLYAAAAALPVTTGGVMCAVNYGVIYDITFMSGDRPVLRINYDQGCTKVVSINGETHDGLHDSAFETALTKAITAIAAGA